MAIEIKTLKPEDFPVLNQAEDGIVLNPENCKAIVAMDGERLVGRMYLVSMFHVEGTWVKEDYRGGSILQRMSKELTATSKEAGAQGLLTFVETPEFDKYLTKQGFKRMPWAVWGKEF